MIHPLAIVHPEAKLGNNVTVEAFAVIKSDVIIGDNCCIGHNAIIWEGARLGKDVKIFPAAHISAIPQDLKFAGEKTETHIGENTIVREFVTISRGTSDSYKTVVGKNCLVMAYVHIAHDCIIGDNCILANAVQLGGHVKVDEWAIISGTSAIHQFVHIGAHSILAGGSLVNKDVPPYVKAARYPLSYAGVNSIGLRRRGFSSDKITEIREIYRTVFLNGLNYGRAIEEIEKNLLQSEERDRIIDFIRSSSRGLMRGISSEQRDTLEE